MSKATRQHYDNGGQEIVIERREVVARIVPNAFGERSMLEEAYLQIGRYFNDHDDHHGLEVSFTYADREFTAALAPSKEFIESSGQAEDEI